MFLILLRLMDMRKCGLEVLTEKILSLETSLSSVVTMTTIVCVLSAEILKKKRVNCVSVLFLFLIV